MSTLKVNKLRDTAGSADAIVLDPNGGAVLAGVTTVTSVKVGAAVTISESGIEASGIGITCANINGAQIGGRRNLIINGDMRIAQRGTSSTSSGYQTVDRFAYDRNGTGAATQSQVADAPEGFKYSLKIDCTTAETSPAANVYNLISQRFEGQNLQHIKKGTSNAQSLTASFYVKGNAAATYTCELRDHDNTRFNSQTFNVTTSWSRVTLTFAPDTTGAFDSDNNLSLYLFFWLSAGSDYSGGTFSSNTWHTTNANRIGDGQTNFFDSTDRTFFLTGVQLEVGSQATAFEHRSFGEELKLCERYCETIAVGEGDGSYINNAVAYFTNQMYSIIRFRTPKRATNPTLVQTTGTNYYRLYRRGGSVDADSFTGTSWPNIHGSAIYNSMNCTDGDAGLLGSSNSDAKLLFTSEL
mgnify:FL=1